MHCQTYLILIRIVFKLSTIDPLKIIYIAEERNKDG
jgi:hypothetical protein